LSLTYPWSRKRVKLASITGDSYTEQAIRHGIEVLLREYGAALVDSPEVPEAIAQRVANMPAEFAERFRAPAYCGQMHAFNLINEFKQTAASTDLISKANEPLLFFGERGEQTRPATFPKAFIFGPNPVAIRWQIR
jgi:hypothetical protein